MNNSKIFLVFSLVLISEFSFPSLRGHVFKEKLVQLERDVDSVCESQGVRALSNRGFTAQTTKSNKTTTLSTFQDPVISARYESGKDIDHVREYIAKNRFFLVYQKREIQDFKSKHGLEAVEIMIHDIDLSVHCPLCAVLIGQDGATAAIDI